MANQIRVPSLQHMARNWRPRSELVARELISLVKSPPIFNYNRLFLAVEERLTLGVPLEQICEGIRRSVKDQKRAEDFVCVMEMLASHFSDISPDYVNRVSQRLYAVRRGLMIPFTPPLVYGVGGQLFFPWFSFWRSNPLARERLALFVTVVREILSDDPDLEDAKFEIIDLSAISAGKGKASERQICVIDADSIDSLDHETKVSMLEVFADGFEAANAHLAEQSEARQSAENSGAPSPDPNQPTFWD